jgi:multidrug resistance efflux pump
MPTNNNELRSKALTEIISSKPPFVLRWGTSIFFVLLIVLLGLTYFVQQPETLTSKATLLATNAPKIVIANYEGRLVNLFAKEGEQVKKGTTIGYIEARAIHDIVLKLDAELQILQQKLMRNTLNARFNLSFNNYNSLGELQNDFQNFSKAYLDYNMYLKDGFAFRKRNMLLNDKKILEQLHNNLVKQKQLEIVDYELTKKNVEANTQLHKEKYLSDYDMRNETSKKLSKEKALPQMDNSIISNIGQQQNKSREILELDNTISQQQTIFLQQLNNMLQAIANWKHKYILTAPIDGIVNFNKLYNENQQIKLGEKICFINPKDNNYFVETTLMQQKLGSIQRGQNVLLDFTSYDVNEYGYVTGKIDFISNIPNDSGYYARVILTNGLKTTYNKEIYFKEGLIAKAHVVTKNMRLIHKIYNSLFRNKHTN